MKKLFLIILLLGLIPTLMAQKISQLPAATTLTGTELTTAVQSNVTKKVTMAQISTYVKSDSLDSDEYLMFKGEYQNLNLIAGLNELNYGIKYLPFAEFAMSSGNALSDTRQYFVAYKITETDTLTGVKFALSQAGDYTADAENSVVLYKWNGTSFDTVATTPNNGNLWKATANTVVTVPFNLPYVASPGWYYVALLYNQSAQTTAPSLYGMELYQNWFVELGTFKLCGYIASRSSHAANVTPAGITRSNVPYFFIIY